MVLLYEKMMKDKSEDELLEMLMNNLDKLTCFDCGKKIVDEITFLGDDIPLGVIYYEKGEINYPREPDTPSVIYFECMECVNERKEGESRRKKMRDIKRMDRILNEIRELWKEYPDQRLGQLLDNYLYGYRLNSHLFFIEDNVIEERLNIALTSIRKIEKKMSDDKI